MASEDDGEKANCTITWIIENVSYCWQKKGEEILSPLFVVDTLENTKWALSLYPRGESDGNYIAYFLLREADESTVENIEIMYEIAFLAADGSVLNYRKKDTRIFEKNTSWGFGDFEKRENVFWVKRSVYLPQDSLTARCRIWKINENAMGTRELFARTTIQVERRSFLWDVEKFSSLEPEEKMTYIVKSACGGSLLVFDLYLKGGLLSEELINMDIGPSDGNVKSLKFQTYLLDAKRKQVDCGQKECLFDAHRNGEHLTLLITKKQLIENETLYLPNNVLSLVCECTFSTGIAFEGFDCIKFGDIPSLTTNEIVQNANTRSGDKRSNTLLDDLKSLYRNQILCDTKLCTKTETFSVHSALLSSRSPVFRAMFTTDMKEKAKESVDIADVDAGTLRQMLLYVYTDTLEIRDWENASLLYAASDKYEIMSLRNLCSFYLKNNFRPTNACQILVLSDMHRDKDLKKVVQDYILKQGVILFDSNEWIRFMEENVKLAAETMHQNWIKN